MTTISPKQVFQTLRKIQLSKDDLDRDIIEYEKDGVIVIINGNCQILDLNFDKIKKDKNISKKIIEAINNALNKMQKKHFDTLKKLTV